MLPKPQRIKFTKTGKLQFISHLDLCRMMKTAVIRAGIPIYYSEGFNPHPKMVFALPLSVGTESVCEFLDIKITEEMPGEEIGRRLGSALPEEMKVLSVYEPASKFTQIGWAEYEIGYEGNADISPLEQKEITVLKRTKSGEKEVDIRPQIKRYEIKKDGLTAVLCADNENYLNPEYIAKLLKIEDYTILRRRILLSDGETEFR